MRDLQADLEICNKATKGPWVFDKYDVDIWSQPNPWRVANVRLYADMQFIAAAREGWPYALERATKAEAEVERLQAENAKLRAVVDAARVYVMEHDKTPNLRTLDEWIIIVAAIRNALAELDKEGE